MKTLLLLSLFLCAGIAEAKYAGAEVNQIPTASLFPSINPIIFPAAVTAAGVNASALGLYGKRTDLQFAYARGSDADPQGLFAGTELGSNGFGVGLGYLGQKYSSNNVNNLYGGMGLKIDPMSFGLGARALNTSGGGGADFDFSMTTAERKGFVFGLVLYSLTRNYRQLDLGLGYAGQRKYNAEINVLLPAFSGDGAQGYTFTGAGTAYATEWLAFTGRLSYQTYTSDFSYMAGATAWMNPTFNVFLFFTSPRTFTGGITFSF